MARVVAEEAADSDDTEKHRVTGRYVFHGESHEATLLAPRSSTRMGHMPVLVNPRRPGRPGRPVSPRSPYNIWGAVAAGLLLLASSVVLALAFVDYAQQVGDVWRAAGTVALWTGAHDRPSGAEHRQPRAKVLCRCPPRWVAPLVRVAEWQTR